MGTYIADIPASVVGTKVSDVVERDVVPLYFNGTYQFRYKYTQNQGSSTTVPMSDSTIKAIDDYLAKNKGIIARQYFDDYGIHKDIKYLGSIPNVNGVVEGYVGGNIRVYLDGDTYYVKTPKFDSQVYAVVKPEDINEIKKQLALIEKNDELSTKSSFEQFNDILQTTFLMALAGGAVYYFFFYNKKGKK